MKNSPLHALFFSKVLLIFLYEIIYVMLVQLFAFFVKYSCSILELCKVA